MDDRDAHSRVEGTVTRVVGLSEKFAIFSISEPTTSYGLPEIAHPDTTELVIPRSEISLPFWAHVQLIARFVLRERIRWRPELDYRSIYG
jgi:hypothetical protein